MPIPLIVRALSALNTAREWFSFTGEAVSALGLTKRVVAGAAGAAVIAGAGVGVVKTVETVSQSPQERARSKAIAVHVPDITPEIRAQVMGVNSENTFSKTFLYEDRNRALLGAIIALCKDGNALPALQCDDATYVLNRLERKEIERAEAVKAKEFNRRFMEGMSTDGIIPR